MWSGPLLLEAPGRIVPWSSPVFRGYPHLLSEAFLPLGPGTATYVPYAATVFTASDLTVTAVTLPRDSAATSIPAATLTPVTQ